MMKLLFLAALAITLSAASIDGKWSVDVQRGGKAAAPDAKKLTFVMDLKSQGETLTGTVSAQNAKGKARSVNISEGKITRDSFRFVTVQKAKAGENRVVWSGRVQGDELTGTRGREGAKRAASFAGKRVK